MIFRQLFDSASSTYTYILGDEVTREAVIIDPVIENVKRDAQLVSELRLTLRYALDTHVHADHVTALGTLRALLGVKTVISAKAGVGCADLTVTTGDVIRFGSYGLNVYMTPGHTDGCLTYVTLDKAMAFTGDALLVRACGRTDFQQGSAQVLYHSIHQHIFSLPETTLIYPAHDYQGRTCTSVGEEKQYNPRIGGGKTVEQFVDIMSKLSLAAPAKIDIALPANLRCGLAPVSAEVLPSKDWAPLEMSSSGVPEVAPDWVMHHQGAVTIIDCREPEEFVGELGHIAQAELVPLATVPAAVNSALRERPVVVVCQSGARSSVATTALKQAGFSQVASMRGGMLAWSASRFPVEQATQASGGKGCG